MKKLIAMILVSLMLMTTAALAEAPAEAPLLGGWQASESPEITEEIQAVFDKAFEELVGVDYVPVAYLGSQVVSGTNYCLLCQATVVYPGALPSYVLVFINETLEGEVTIMNIVDFDFGAFCEYGLAEE